MKCDLTRGASEREQLLKLSLPTVKAHLSHVIARRKRPLKVVLTSVKPEPEQVLKTSGKKRLICQDSEVKTGLSLRPGGVANRLRRTAG